MGKGDKLPGYGLGNFIWLCFQWQRGWGGGMAWAPIQHLNFTGVTLLFGLCLFLCAVCLSASIGWALIFWASDPSFS